MGPSHEVLYLFLLFPFGTCFTDLDFKNFWEPVQESQCDILKAHINNRYAAETRHMRRLLYRQVLVTTLPQVPRLLQKEMLEAIQLQTQKMFTPTSPATLREQRKVFLYKVKLNANLRDLEKVQSLFQEVKDKIKLLVSRVGPSDALGSAGLKRQVDKFNMKTHMVSIMASLVADELERLRKKAKIMLMLWPSHPTYKFKELYALSSNHMRKFEQLVMQMKMNSQELQAVRKDQVSESGQVKFHIRQSGVANMSLSTTFKFDTVIYNVGDGYNYKTGVFTAPRSGKYSIWSRMICSSALPFNITIIRNGQNVSNTLCTSYKSSLLSTIVHAQSMYISRGDRVWFEHDGVEQMLGISASRYGGMLLSRDGL